MSNYPYVKVINGRVLRVDNGGGYCPAQFFGFVHGREFYFRARHGEWYFAIKDRPESDIIMGYKCELYEGLDVMDGYMEFETAIQLMTECLEGNSEYGPIDR